MYEVRTALLGSALLVLAGFLAWSGDLRAGELGEAGLPATPADEIDVLEREYLWPYRVALVTAWDDGGRRQKPIPSGRTGVLIRIEGAGRARVDFGRDGLAVVPVEATDLRSRMAAVASGELEKDAPNLVMAIGPRMLEASRGLPQVVSFLRVGEFERFLCVFFEVDVSDTELADLARMLQRLTDGRSELVTVLFPIGEQKDPVFARRLHETGWDATFLPDHLADTYVMSLIGEDSTLPRVQLSTAEGRVLFEDEWSEDALSKLSTVLGPQPAANPAEGA